ncbi:Oligopeptide transport system permease protein OppC (TC 3.A.1.5.1) [hydrothermal vent metagenome]|uniref:Oligopeptide transport system permease protein OppC (TC 3.A.1.5.1) n=1 Tax=hydrothermal vent metagenome TaxID=652676 RepID=A0A3B1BEC1_9ZZZZ
MDTTVTSKPSRFGLASVLGLWLPLIVIVLWALVALTASFLPLAPDQIALEHILLPPGSELWLGADDLGRSLAERTLAGAQTSFIVALWVVLVSAVVGTAIGTFSGYLGGRWDLLVVRIIDIFLAFPGILLAIALAGILGPGIENVVIALSVVGWVGYARLARAQVLSLKHREHVQAAIALGAGPGRIVFRHLLPLLMAPLIVEASFGIAGIVIAEAGLSFLGLGVQPPEASWGSMIRDGARYLLVAPHMVLVPGVALMLVVLSVNLLGDRLRDKLDVRNRKR